MFETKEELEFAIAEAEKRLRAKYGDKMDERVNKTKKVLEKVALANNMCCSKACFSLIEIAQRSKSQEAEDVYLVILKGYQVN